MALLHFERTSTIERSLIAAIGELDLGSAPRLCEAMAEADGEEVIVDLRHLEFMDSAGPLALAQATDDAASRGTAVRVIAGPPNIDRLFELTETRSRFAFIERGSVQATIAELRLD